MSKNEVPIGLESLITSVIEEAGEHDQQYQSTLNKVRDNTTLVTKTPWLRHTKWEEIFVGKDMKECNKLSEAPGDYKERRLWDSTTRVLTTTPSIIKTQ